MSCHNWRKIPSSVIHCELEQAIKKLSLTATGVILLCSPIALMALELENNSLPSQVLPRLEAGLAGAGLNVSAYPSSSVRSQRNFLVPWLIYRSDKVQVKDGGVKLIAYQSEKLTVDLGISGSLNADTSITPVRDGMPDIDYLLELGPRFKVPLFDRTNEFMERDRLDWVTAYRFAISTDFGRVDFRGPVLNTELSYEKEGLLKDKLTVGVSVGATWLGNQMMDYFYSVDSQFATPDRPEYRATAGFLGVDLSAGVEYNITPNASVFVSAGIESFSGSRNDDSPLFEEDLSRRLILGFAWTLYQSKDTVRVTDE